jgi:(p)ppGpp synthase/HD superfamily hydrolase
VTTILKALEFAVKKHEGQFRKGSGLEYVTHTIAVSYLVGKYKTSKRLEYLIIAAILHDTLEDTDTSFIELAEEFGPLVASLVLELTNDPEQIKKFGKLEYQKRKCLGISSYALVIKLCDRLHNISDQPTDKMVSDTDELLDFLKKNRNLSKTQKEIITAIEKKIEEIDLDKS